MRFLISILLTLVVAGAALGQTPDLDAPPPRATAPALPADLDQPNAAAAPDLARPRETLETPHGFRVAPGAAPDETAATAAADPAPPPAASGIAPATPEPGATPPGATPRSAADALNALADVLRDEAARAILLDEIARLAPGGDAAGETAAPAGVDAAAESAPPTLGERLASLADRLVAETRESVEEFLNGLNATERRLRAIRGERLERLAQTGIDLLGVVATVAVLQVVGGWLTRRLFHRMRPRLTEAGVARRTALWVLALLAEVAVVLVAWVAGHAVAFASLVGAEQSDEEMLRYTIAFLFLNAFLVVQLARVAIRAIMAPQMPEFRLPPFSDAGAAYWSSRLGGLTAVMGYGLVFLVPVVAEIVSVFTGAAVRVLVFAVMLLWAMAIVIRHRRAPAAYLSQRADAAGGDATLRLLAALARYVHIPALIYLFTLFTAAVSRSGNIEPLLSTSGLVALVVVLGAAASAAATHVATHGVRMPPEWAARLPNAEQRVNGFLSSFATAARAIIAIATLGVAVQVTGLFDVDAWFRGLFGEDFFSAIVSVTLIVVVAFAVWLALASWVDYRLNPNGSMAASARQQTLLTLLRNAATVAIIVFTLMFTLSELGLDIAPLLASAGVLGLAIGFGAQKLVQDIITGIFIQFESAINVGDVVTVAGTTGAVEKLTIRSVSLRALDGTFHIIPFSSVDMVSNFNRGFAFHVADVGIAYREDIDEAKALMHTAFDDIKQSEEFGRKIFGALEWFGVNALGDSAVVLRARIRTRPGEQWGVGRAYNEAVKKRFDAAGVEIPFPHTTVWFGQNRDASAPPLHLAVDRAPKTPDPLAPSPAAATVAAPTADAPPDAGADGGGDGAGRG